MIDYIKHPIMLLADHIPFVLKKNNLIFCKLIYTSRLNSSIIAITRGLKLYEIINLEILSECDLSKTLLKELPESIDFDDIEINVRFTYNGGKKQIFYILKINNSLLTLIKHKHGIQINQEFENVVQYETEELTSETVNLHLQLKNGKNITHSLECKTALPKTDHLISEEEFGSTIKIIKDRINEAKTELKSIRLEVEKTFTDLSLNMKFGPNTIRGDTVDEKLMLVKFGDLWLKTYNEKIVFGIPIFNSTFKRKRTLENIRVTVTSPQIAQLHFNYNLYKFEIDENLLPNFENFINLEDEKPAEHDLYDQEWICSQNNILLPETVAVAIIKTDLFNFIEHSSYVFNFMLLYQVESFTLQNFAGTVTVTSDILHKNIYRTLFNNETIFKDLLTVISTSTKISINVKLKDIHIRSNLYEFLQNQLEFVEVYKSDPLENEEKMDIADDSIQSTENDNQLNNLIKMFYNTNGYYWKDTLIKIRKYDESNILGIKIYNKSDEKALTFIRTLITEFHNQIEINSDCFQRKEIILRELQQAFCDEADFVVKLNIDIDDEKSTLTDEQSSLEYKTDCLLLLLK